jgi:enhancing lycopene biosynthesis protein 2
MRTDPENTMSNKHYKASGMTVGVILGGCGRHDGSEITEAVSTLIALDQRGTAYQCLAPNIPQRVVFDHLKERAIEGESRNVLTESARIARGDVKDLASVKGSDFDALIIPGGDGTAKNLNTFALEGASCSVNPTVERFLNEAHDAGKPIGFICIAPTICASVFGKSLGPSITIGKNADVAAAIGAMGATNVPCSASEIAVDKKNRFVSTPAYMEAKGPAEVFEGVSKLVDRVLEMAEATVRA